MTFFSKKSIIILFLLFVGLRDTRIHASDASIDTIDSQLDLLLEEFDEEAFLADQATQSKACPTSPEEIASLAVQVGLDQLLRENFYLKTYPLNARSLLTLPIFLPLRNPASCYGWTVGSHLFWNQTDAMFFTRKSSALCSYLGINEPTLLDKLSSIEIIQSLGIKPEKILPLFKNMTINERRLGFMLHAQRQYERLGVRIMAPIYYFERNLFCTEQEKTAIERALGQTTDEEQMEFAKKHLICDKIGLGDTRVVLDYKLCPEALVNSTLGLFFTVPTAFPFASGLLGSSFNKTCKPPVLNFMQLFDLVACEGEQGIEKAKKIGENFVLGALDNFSAVVLNRPLGNYGHFGIGGQYTSETPLHVFIKRPWAEHVTMKSRISLEYFLPAMEKRFFIECNKAADFTAVGLDRSKQQILDQINSDPAYAARVLAFLEKELTEKFYPFPFKAKVWPGVAFQWTSKIFYEANKWGLYAGTDTWARTGEKITCLNTNKNSPKNLAITKAQQKFNYQTKVLGGLFYKMARSNKDITLSLNADNTIISSGIGQDFTVSLNLEFNF